MDRNDLVLELQDAYELQNKMGLSDEKIFEIIEEEAYDYITEFLDSKIDIPIILWMNVCGYTEDFIRSVRKAIMHEIITIEVYDLNSVDKNLVYGHNIQMIEKTNNGPTLWEIR